MDVTQQFVCPGTIVGLRVAVQGAEYPWYLGTVRIQGVGGEISVRIAVGVENDWRVLAEVVPWARGREVRPELSGIVPDALGLQVPSIAAIFVTDGLFARL